MDRTGEQARRSICDEIEARVDASSFVKALTLAWLIPGVSLTWAGFASSGIRTASAETVRRSLEQTQAFAVMLIIFYTLVGAIWALRTWDQLRSVRRACNGPVFRPATLSAFAAAILFQVTIGWLHLLDPTSPYAVTLIAQGLLLAWTAIAAAREFGAVQRALRFDRSAQSISQEPARRPLPEPAVGH